MAGDAAHVHSPASGQGMNAGTLDAMCLAEALTKAPGHRAARAAPRAHALWSLLAQLPPFRRQLAWRLSGLVYR